MNEILYSGGEASVDKIKDEFLLQGAGKVHVLADFDNTLTKKFVSGEERPSMIAILRQEKILGEEYSQKALKLYNTYQPIEVNPNISLTEKREKMQEWWSKHLQLFIDTGLKQDHITKALNHSGLKFREGVQNLLSTLHEQGIPLVIISANGIGGESIRQFLTQQNIPQDNIYIVSNEFVWNKEGRALAYQGGIIHSFNKDETSLQDFPEVRNVVEGRKNIILLGDSLGDTMMAEGIPIENILKIGFLNKNREELEAKYREIYDVVIPNDGDFRFPNAFLQSILK